MLEFGIPTENLPLPQRARDRFPIFVRAAWRLFVENPRLMILYGGWAVFFGADHLVLREGALAPPGELPFDSAWAGFFANGLLTNTVSRIVDCAALVAVLSLMRGRELDLRRGFSSALRVLVPIMLLALVVVGIDLAGRLADVRTGADLAVMVTSPALIALGLVLFYAVAILADTGGGIEAAITGSWSLFRRTWRDVVPAIIALWAAALILTFVPLIAFGLAVDGEVGLVSVPGQIVGVILILPLSTFSAFYAARLYLFARSVEAAAERREGAAD